jgi:hypothetical protein
MLATVVATLVASALMRDSIMTEKLTRRGLRVLSDYHADILATIPVAAVMTPDVEAIDLGASAGDAARRFRRMVTGPIRSWTKTAAALRSSPGSTCFETTTSRPTSRARQTLQAREQLEPGWRPRRMQSPPSTNGNRPQEEE